MRILHVISNIDPRAGGTTSALAGMARAQAEAGLSVAIVATHGHDLDHATVNDLEARGVSVSLVGPVRTSLQVHPAIDETLRRGIEDCDVVHIHALWEQVQHRAARLAAAHGKPYIISPHGMLDPWSLSQKRWKKRLYMAWRLRRNLDRAAAMHFTARAEQDLVQPLQLRAPGFVEPLGLHLDEFETLPDPGTFRRRHPQLENRPVILFLSRLHYKKGLDRLVEALARLKDSRAMLVVAGPDADGYQAKIESQCAQLGVRDRVLFTGMIRGREKLAAMADADLFVLPSHQENFGIVVVEALAAGTPTLVSDRVNLCTDVVEAHVGEVVSLEPGVLADQIDRWLADHRRREAAARRARPFVWERFNWTRIAERWREHYQRIVRLASDDRPDDDPTEPSSPSPRFRIVEVGGRPRLAVPVASRPVRLAAVRRLQANTWKKRVFRAGVQLLIAAHADAWLLPARTVRPTDGTSSPMRFSAWLDELTRALGDSTVLPVLIWPPQADRLRLYVHLLDQTGQPRAFVKVALDESNAACLEREARMLQILASLDLKYFRVPTVLSSARFAGYTTLVTEPVPTSAQPARLTLNDFPRQHVVEFAGEPHQAGPEDLQKQAWWRRLFEQDSHAMPWIQQLETAVEPGLKVNRVHGDFGNHNLLQHRSQLWIMDWEHSHDQGPWRTDEVSFWIGLHQRAATRQPAETVEQLRRYAKQAPIPIDAHDLLAAVAYLHAAGISEASMLLRHWGSH